jgi:hypothetical protein
MKKIYLSILGLTAFGLGSSLAAAPFEGKSHVARKTDQERIDHHKLRISRWNKVIDAFKKQGFKPDSPEMKWAEKNLRRAEKAHSLLTGQHTEAKRHRQEETHEHAAKQAKRKVEKSKVARR